MTGGGFQPPPGAQPPWPPQPGGQWQPAPPPKRGNGWKWVLGAVALLAVIGVTVAVTLLVSGDDNGDTSPTAAPTNGNGASSDIASANDTGPVTIITEDPSCAPVQPILETRAVVQRNGWDQRDPSIPATEWTPEMSAQYMAVAESMRASADQLVPIAKMTPHRVMREIYEQLIAYSLAYAEAIPSYTPPNEDLAIVTTTASNVVSNICAAIDFGSAASRAPLVTLPPTPTQIAPLGDPADPTRFLTDPNPVCEDWSSALSDFQREVSAWMATSPDIPVSQWTPEQRAATDEARPVLGRFSSQLRELGVRSSNPTLQDFAELSAQYRDTYVKSIPTYTPADQYLAKVSNLLAGVVNAACRAAQE